MEPHHKLQKEEGKPVVNSTKFRQLVGSLIYLTITRPDLSYSVDVSSQFMENLQVSHLEAGKRILRYVKSTLEYGLFYKKNEKFVLSRFVYSDWAGDINDRRSTTGYCFNMSSAAISWCSKKQPNVALSNTEAEYCVATMAAQECVWLKMLISDIYEKVGSQVLRPMPEVYANLGKPNGWKVRYTNHRCGPWHRRVEARLFHKHRAKVVIVDILAELGQKGKLDIIFNNAAIIGTNKPNILNHDVSEFEKIINVNLIGAFLGTKHAAHVMIPNGHGSIITNGSVCTTTGGVANHGYTSQSTGSWGLLRILLWSSGGTKFM
ncbi:hypothetical protein BUALT_Bualt02G0023400 [Buddleja alternifolia]|uniref:Uncharacterized protein n=1 Tax=Buddleja alternifolia TaxID=168488 RepID=A0AAV6Y7H9_9LAMI|nr:hypothetical protein BUALT_Bualt02G0023400 [Buddleja alternifolia]